MRIVINRYLLLGDTQKLRNGWMRGVVLTISLQIGTYMLRGRWVSNKTLTLFGLCFFGNGKTGGGSKWPYPLKSSVNRLRSWNSYQIWKNNFFLNIYKKKLTENFDIVSIFVPKMAKLGEDLKNVCLSNEKSYHEVWYHFGKYLVYSFCRKIICSKKKPI